VVDIVHNWVIARMVVASDVARQATGTVETSIRNDQIQSGTGPGLARYHMQLVESRLAAEAARLQQRYPALLVRKA
jgi:hypothetical protein